VPKSTDRFAPPAAVRGVSLVDVRAQRKADKEVEELLRAESPYADAKAFALGLSSGAALSYGSAAPGLVADFDRTQKSLKQQAHLANWLQSQGMDEKAARRSASGLQRFLSMPGPPREAEEAARKFMAGGFRIEGAPRMYNTRQQAEAILKNLGPAGEGRNIVEVAGTLPSGPRAADVLPKATDSKRVLDAAREAFEAAGKKGPGMGRALGVVARRHAPYAAFAGLLAGLGSVALTRNRRKELKELRRYAREN
jgi:hypothetical protein